MGEQSVGVLGESFYFSSKRRSCEFEDHNDEKRGNRNKYETSLETRPLFQGLLRKREKEREIAH
jgi:hypothetical protein